MAARILFVILAVTVFALDRAAKLVVEHQLYLGERVEVLGGGLLELRRVHNPGIAFGLLSEAGFLVVIGSLVVGALLFFFLLRVETDDWLSIIGGALITGGALGNLVDRIKFGYVIDFIRLPRFPTFNIADVAITVGVVLVVLSQLVASRRELAAAKAEEVSSDGD